MCRCIAIALIWLFSQIFNATVLAQGAPVLELVGEFRWQNDAPKFGGFSGLEVSADGTMFWMVSDGGLFAQGRFERSQGQVSDVQGAEFYDLKSPSGQVLEGVWNDAEGLAIDARLRAYISFEGEHRIWRYDQPGGLPTPVDPHPDFAGLQNNSALEVLAIDGQDRLLTLPERSGVLTRPFPVYRQTEKGWSQPFGLRRQSPFLPVGGDFGPDGKFYLLERHLSGLWGFQSRIRRFTVTKTGLENEETLLETRPGLHDNLEGIAIWQDQNGDIRITMISDDNYRAFQRTEFVEYRLLE